MALEAEDALIRGPLKGGFRGPGPREEPGNPGSGVGTKVRLQKQRLPGGPRQLAVETVSQFSERFLCSATLAPGLARSGPAPGNVGKQELNVDLRYALKAHRTEVQQWWAGLIEQKFSMDVNAVLILISLMTLK